MSRHFYRDLAGGLPIRTPRALRLRRRRPHAAGPRGSRTSSAPAIRPRVCDWTTPSAASTPWPTCTPRSGRVRSSSDDLLFRPLEGQVGDDAGADDGERCRPASRGRSPTTSRPAALRSIPDEPAGWEAFFAHLAEGPRTLVHNDCRLDNLFFEHDGTPVFVDWQTVANARGTRISRCCSAAAWSRRTSRPVWERLVTRYHDSYCASGVHDFSFDDCSCSTGRISSGRWVRGRRCSVRCAASDPRGVGRRIVVRALSHIDELDAFAAFSSA